MHYRVRGRLPNVGTWLEVELETGRTHQIRVQAASRGHAVLGDAQYGSTVPFGEQFEDERLRAIALHARQLGFHHPMTNEPVDVTARLPLPWLAPDSGLGRVLLSLPEVKHEIKGRFADHE
jgi:23S rRNA pseudouridine1911/1915/1917 synthase